MIDIEAQIYTKCREAVKEVFPDIYVANEPVSQPEKLPAAVIYESNNSTLTRTSDSASTEQHVSVFYNVDVYSNKHKLKKSECKNILKVIDEVLLSYNFSRMGGAVILGVYGDSSITRMNARYVANVSKDNVIFRR